MRVVLSWCRPAPGGFLSRMGQMLVKVTEPYLRVFRRLIPISRLGMSAPHDFSILVALLLLYVVIHVLIAV